MILLAIREEIVCILILSFLIFYYLINKAKDKEMLFLKVAGFALLNLIFDLVTVITVNNRDIVPDSVNRLLHILFYISGILFIRVFYSYVVGISSLYKHMQLLRRAGYVPLILFIVLLLFLPMEYVEGRGTNYSFGPLAFLGYGLFLLYCAACMVILLLTRDKIDKRIRRTLIPIFSVMFAAVIIQAFVPELLMTGGNATLICVGMFAALDNPDKDYEKQALWDFLTGLKNRNCYNKDLERYINIGQYSHNRRHIGFLMADLNLLKKVNDNYGHMEGDKLIKGAAVVLRDNLLSAENVYRLGGDEFVAIYLSPNDATVAAEMKKVASECMKADGFAVPLSIAMGYASGRIDEGVSGIVERADQLMYENKAMMKMQRD